MNFYSVLKQDLNMYQEFKYLYLNSLRSFRSTHKNVYKHFCECNEINKAQCNKSWDNLYRYRLPW